MALAAIPAIPLLARAGSTRYLNGPCRAATRVGTLAAPNETGERMLVRGQVFRPDGATPAADVIVYAYHTDATGFYRTERDAPPRLRGWMRTDNEGRFELHSIKPAPYPNRAVAAHVHFQFWGEDVEPQSAGLLFEGDRFITEKERRESDALGRFGSIKQLGKDAAGVLVATIDFRLKTHGTYLEESIRHGLNACR
jgi:protocatechuate 3,4-dioxygenase beta subunit